MNYVIVDTEPEKADGISIVLTIIHNNLIGNSISSVTLSKNEYPIVEYQVEQIAIITSIKQGRMCHKIFTFAAKQMTMTTIVINIQDKTKANQILEAVRLLKGVTNATIATDDELENISMLKACKAARKTAKTTKAEVLNALK